ncbi:MAG: CDGSH iron-sulfur domain-containing protein [Nitrospirota bacterium]
MKEPIIAQKEPYIEEMEPGKYWWCACGRSESQPFCDSMHSGTGIGPMAVTIDQKKKVAWCGCKQTKTPPFCDGSHSQL